MSVTVKVSDQGASVTLSIMGRFDFSLHNEFRKSYKDLDVMDGEYIVDLGLTEYLDSSALGMLLLLKEHAETQSAVVKLLNANDDIKEILTIASFDKLFLLD